MSLVVVDSDEEASAYFREQLRQLGFDPVPATNLKLALEMCGNTPPELVITTQVDWAKKLTVELRRLPVVLANDQEQDSDSLLAILRAGIVDVWQLPASKEFLKERIDSILSRIHSTATHAENQLRQHVADLQRDQRAGRYIQMGMLPPNPMAIDRYRFHHRIIPSMILSGDFVDYFRITDRHFAFYIADVSGHGASSAFVTVLLKNFSRRLRREYRPSMLTNPGEILEWFNRELLEQKIDKHVAMLMAIGDLDNDSVCLVNAGHFPPAILVRDGSAHFIEQKGKPVGLFDEVNYTPKCIDLRAGDRLVIFSDGVLDALDEPDLSAKEARLLKAAALGGEERKGRNNARVGYMDSIWQSLDLGPGRSVPDDMTCLTVQRGS